MAPVAAIPALFHAPPGDPALQSVLLALVLVMMGARIGGTLCARYGLPTVLGELAAGVLLGNVGLVGWHGLDGVRSVPTLTTLGGIGALFLLFDVGLRSDLRRLLEVGGSSLLVATLGVLAPIGLGAAVSAAFFPGRPAISHVFVGATLCATSVGITARVLADLDRLAAREGRIILAAAVADDVLGLVVLAIVSGVIARGGFAPGPALQTLLLAAAFLAAAIGAGGWLSRQTFRVAARLPGEGKLVMISLSFCFGLAWLAGALGLAPIVGAFAAGLVMDETHYQDLRARDRARRSMTELMEPMSTFLVPVFFVLMGMRVDLAGMSGAHAWAFAGALALVAVASKQVCGLGVLGRADRVLVGLGMVPRGEVGLIFANLGAGLVLAGAPVLDHEQFAAVVLVVAATTLITPPLLAWRLRTTAPRA
ncbi:MAG TPA: cation:proton antiporter [Candidatus Eisenbacteria bacterium]|nr:cation:proton antiporter [Candidatus Eisenbacteria bacterium]